MAKILYHAVPVPWRKEEKYAFLEKTGSVANVKWKTLKPDKKQNWLDRGYREEFGLFLPVGDHDSHAGGQTPPVFKHFSNGVKTHRDEYAVNFDAERVAKHMGAMVDAYNAQVDAWHRLKKKPAKVEDFLDYASGKISWSRDLKKDLERGRKAEFAHSKIRRHLYRPFTKDWLFFDRIMNEEVYGFPDIFPAVNNVNRAVCVTDCGSEKPFMVLASDRIVDLHLVGAGASCQCFSLYTYSEDGKHRQDNVTLQALTRFQIFYDDDSITRQDIFHYVYALLHHPAYRSRYAENLKRELPRIPFVSADGSLHGPKEVGRAVPSAPSPARTGSGAVRTPRPTDKDVFHAFAKAGEKLADLHVNYEEQKEFKLRHIENKSVPLDWRVEAMKLTKDRASLIYNDFLTLGGIPPEVFDYKLGNRSALEWVIDQYRVTRDAHGQITSDPNRDDDEQYIVRLIGQVITVSLETQKAVNSLPAMRFE